MMRFSLRNLLAAFVFVAVVTSGLLYPNRFWASVCFTAALMIVLLSVVAALVRSGPARAYWIGFAVFSGVYLLLSIYADVQLNMNGGRRGSWDEPKLLTSQLLLWSDEWLTRLRPSRAQGIVPGSDYVRSRFPIAFISRGWTGNTLIIGHSVLAIVVGLLGGWWGGWLYRREPATNLRSDGSQ